MVNYRTELESTWHVCDTENEQAADSLYNEVRSRFELSIHPIDPGMAISAIILLLQGPADLFYAKEAAAHMSEYLDHTIVQRPVSNAHFYAVDLDTEDDHFRAAVVYESTFTGGVGREVIEEAIAFANSRFQGHFWYRVPSLMNPADPTA